MDKDETYIDDLNYEWIPGNESYVVIIGDMIDGKRPKINTDEEIPKIERNGRDSLEHEYPQIEIKILRFILFSSNLLTLLHTNNILCILEILPI